MKLAWEPGRVVGGGAAIVMAALALLVKYGVLDVEGAGLWAAFFLPFVPIVQAEISRRFTVSVAKIEDAQEHRPGISVKSIVDAANVTRHRKRVARDEAERVSA